MATREIVKEYKKGEFTIVWKPAKCIHSEVCVKRLPEVYRPKEKPWIQPENADVSALRSQIEACPSGALTYKDVSAAANDTTEDAPTARPVPGGPLLVKGNVRLETEDGEKLLEGSTAFCRCGASANKPFCDGSHKEIEFDT